MRASCSLLNSRELNSRELNSRELNSRELNSRELNSREQDAPTTFNNYGFHLRRGLSLSPRLLKIDIIDDIYH
jgi:hypothetical protein